MYLKRLELHGFKSFPEKVRLEFGRGITAVVGPNGSGKSNVSDALRWALGEQSAKSLRGAKMEDVIFAGTQNRRPLGFAEVVMCVDNEDRKLPVDFSELTVTRRVYRSGESQYMINDAVCRLKDIHELFMDTGVGREGYSIIGQGRIDEILSAKSDERRLLFEEAAGIVKYKNRKADAETRLERERQNLERVRDVINELENQLAPLAEQAETARRFLKMSERRKLLSINLFLIETDALAEAGAKAEKAAGDARAQAEREKARLAESREAAGRARADAARAASEIEGMISSEGALSLAIEQEESRIALCRQKDGQLQAEKVRLEGEVLLKRQAITDGGAAKAELEDKRRESGAEARRAEETVAARQNELDELSGKLARAEETISGYQSDHIDHIRATTDIAQNISRAEAMYEQFEARKEELDAEREALAEKRARLEAAAKSHAEDLERKAAQTALLAERIESLFEEKYRSQQELIAGNAERDKKESVLREAAARHKTLSEMERTHEGFYKSVRDVLRAKEREPGRFRGICGVVADLAAPRRGFETAAEVALGGAVQNIVAETEDDAAAAIQYLKSSGAGRATFLPISAVKARQLKDRARLVNLAGVLGTADEFVTYEPRYAGIFQNLLAATLVVDNINNAVEIQRRNRHELRIVTKEGELLSPGGAMTGGSVNKGGGVLSRAGEIAELAERIAKLTEETRERAELNARLAAAIDAVSDQIEKNKMLTQEIALGKANVAAAAEQAAAAIAELDGRNGHIAAEERLAMEKIVHLNAQIRNLRNEKREAESKIADVLEELASLRAAFEAAKGERDKKQKELTEARVRLSRLSESGAHIAENIERIEREARQFAKESENCLGLIAEGERGRAELADEIERRLVNIESLKEKSGEAAEKAGELRGAHAALLNKADELENAAIAISETVAGLNAEAARLEEQKERREEESRKWFDAMWDEYGITRQAALKYERLDMHHAAVTKEERELKAAIRDLGPVNTAAIEEFRAVGERHAFLKSQRDDIIEAEDRLKEIIRELERLMRDRFAGQFKIISDNFGAVFSEMFGGGTAFVRLADDGDALTAGIDIIAQPPGKRLQNMNLFSGGERALTATALLFAILRMKPSPFCVLDEVEAALDDANVKRYANFLKNFSGDTQFIIITHRKGTMEAADTLYGVTMQEQGVSKLVGVRFDG